MLWLCILFHIMSLTCVIVGGRGGLGSANAETTRALATAADRK